MLVSCICLTNDRPSYLPMAIKCFYSQTYKNKELVIIDNGRTKDDAMLVPDDPSIIYYKVQAGLYNHGGLMNLACEHSNGEIIATWDSDDWSCPIRLDDQVRRLESTGKSLTGYSQLYFWDTDNKASYIYTGPEDYASGTSQTFRRPYWQEHKFDPIKYGADGRFSAQASKEKAIVAVSGLGKIVARSHSDSTCPPKYFASCYRQIETKQLPAEFWKDL